MKDGVSNAQRLRCQHVVHPHHMSAPPPPCAATAATAECHARRRAAAVPSFLALRLLLATAGRVVRRTAGLCKDIHCLPANKKLAPALAGVNSQCESDNQRKHGHGLFTANKFWLSTLEILRVARA